MSDFPRYGGSDGRQSQQFQVSDERTPRYDDANIRDLIDEHQELHIQQEEQRDQLRIQQEEQREQFRIQEEEARQYQQFQTEERQSQAEEQRYQEEELYNRREQYQQQSYPQQEERHGKDDGDIFDPKNRRLSEEIRQNPQYHLPQNDSSLTTSSSSSSSTPSSGEPASMLGGLSWIQSTPTLLVAGVVVAMTLPPLIAAGIRYLNGNKGGCCGGSKGTTDGTTNGGKTCKIVDIEDCATTCSPDGCECECPFPLRQHNVKQDGDKIIYSPIAVKVPETGSKWICTCGQSKNFPYCDGSHSAYNNEHGTNMSPYELNKETCPGKDTVYICGCGHSKQRKARVPFCDGSHVNVKPLDLDETKKDDDNDEAKPDIQTIEPPSVADDLQ